MSFVHKSKKAAYTAARKAAAQGEYEMSDVEIVPVSGGYEIRLNAEQLEDLTDEQRAAVQASEEQLACATDPRQDAIPLGDTPVESSVEPVEGRFPPIRFPDMEPEDEPTPPEPEPEPAPQDPCEPEPEVPPQIEATGTLADFARAECERKGIVPLGSTGRTFILCVEDGFPQTSPEAWAMELARKLKLTVTIRDAVTFERLAEMSYRSKAEVRREERKSRPPCEGAKRTRETATEPRGMELQIIELATRPGGVTRAELAQRISSKAHPWTTLLKKAAARWDYQYATETNGRITIYFLRRLAIAAE